MGALFVYGFAPLTLFPSAAHVFGFPYIERPYADSWVIVAGAEALSQGRDPLVDSPTDPWRRSLNYPRAVAHVAHFLGVGPADVALLGRGFALIFVVGLLLMPRPPGSRQILVTCIFLVSPPVIFGLERGNLDIAVFGLMAAACFRAPVLLAPLVPLLCAIKIYPVFAGVPALLHSRGRKRMLWILVIICCALYGWLIYPDLRLIRANTPTWSPFSWGVGTLRLNRLVAAPVWLPWTIALLALLGGFLAGLRASPAPQKEETEARLVSAALSGAFIYIGCYFLGTNFNYRLIFLILLVPLLLSKTTASSPMRDRRAAAISLVILLLAFWSESLYLFLQGHIRGSWLVDEVAPLAALAVCGRLLGMHLSLPTFKTPQQAPAP